MYSIFHFWTHLVGNRKLFSQTEKLDKFKFDVDMLSCNNAGVFPDLAINLQNLQNFYPRRKRSAYYEILPLRVQILLRLRTRVASHGVFCEE